MRRVTIDRLLVLLLSLSFLLLAPPAAAHDIGQMAAPGILSEQKGEKPSPAPVPSPPDDAALFLLTTAPEAPAPAGTDDSGGHDGLALPAVTALPYALHVDHGASSTGLATVCLHRARPWATGPPRA